MSSAYSILNQNGSAPTASNQTNPLQTLQNIRQFANGLRGNPEDIVRGLLSSGRMSQEQFNQLSKEATQIMQMFGNGGF